jgi:hypothetical protein
LIYLLQDTLRVCFAVMVVVVLCVRAMIEQDFIKDQLAKYLFVESVLFKLEVEILNASVIRLIFDVVKIFEIGVR